MSFGHLLILTFILLLLFGGKKLPELGGALGKGLRAFKDGLEGKTQVEDKSNEDPKNPKT